MTIALITIGFLVLIVAIMAVHDLIQRKHAVTRNFPVIGHFRYFFEEMGQPLRQYFFAGDLDERPYNALALERDLQMITHACGLTHPSHLHRGHVVMNISPGVRKTLVKLFPYPPNQSGLAKEPNSRAERWSPATVYAAS